MSAAPTGKLQRVLGLGFGVAAVVGGSIGSGILRAPGPVAAALPSGSAILLVWFAGGLLTLVEAMPMIELATALPRAGGPTVYVERAFGHAAGTLIGWGNWIQCIIALGFMAVVFGEYAQRLGFGTSLPTGALAAGLLLMLTLLNSAGTRTSGASQSLGTIVKVGGMLLLIAALLTLAPPAAAAPPATAAVPLGLVGTVVALRLVMNTYQGWNAVTFMSEELHAPGRTMARALFIGIGVITAVYVAMNLALLHALPVATIAASNLPVADAIATFAGENGERLATLVALVAVVTIANLTIMYPSRILYAMAGSGALPRAFGTVTANGTPIVAVLAATALAAAMAVSGSYLILIAVAGPMFLVTHIAVALAAIRLRTSEPELDRPWRMPLHPLPALVVLAINGALLVAFFVEDPVHSAWSLGLMALGLLLLLRPRLAVAA